MGLTCLAIAAFLVGAIVGFATLGIFLITVSVILNHESGGE